MLWEVPLLIALMILLATFAGILYRGAPYLPTLAPTARVMLEMAHVQPGERLADLGAGDGRLVIAFARAGAEAHGYELNPILVWLGHLNIWRAGLKGKAFMHQANLFGVDCSQFNVVIVFGLDRYGFMERLATKLRAELPNGARVVSNAFRFPGWEISDQRAGAFLYRQNC